ncbi:hypothetical protein HL273_19090 [Yersinia enterocolitica]|uniref:hypothetical protein n=1 Tax=Yersinia enterocolitica TaxID=630 RepID=UPI00155A15C1|nr:hypothetical protein [Yersinia enterocolitica]MBX9484462.1 hypothetical protein [Yersinia enterocolitica]NQS96628.1 hypothetical protein [Yersinia enterocolitica]NQT45386.1 hypothetical protein [Yersinia enterocolitica]NQU01999.1 hypothetical protein [Yersinia enterocolitica]
MYKFDRELQKYILTNCIAVYPGYTSWNQFPPEIQDYGDDVLCANILYLNEHRLITIRNQKSDDLYTFLDNMKATATGVDFMLQDGGIGAILGVHTFKFHKDAVVVLEDLIAISNMSKDEKERAKSALSELPLEALKSVVQAVTTAGLAALTK